MGLSVAVEPTAEPLQLAEVKKHLRVDIPDDDLEISQAITDARVWIEDQTRRSLASKTYDLTLSNFPASTAKWPSGAIELPIQPVTSVSYVHYVNTSGATTSYADTTTSPETPYWTALTDHAKTVIIPNWNRSWPDVREHGNAVTVRFVAGYTTLPGPLNRAMKLMIGNWYEYREEGVLFNGMVQQIAYGVEALISPYRLVF